MHQHRKRTTEMKKKTLKAWSSVALRYFPQKTALFCWDSLERFWQQTGYGGRAPKERIPVPELQKFCLGTGDKKSNLPNPTEHIDSRLSFWNHTSLSWGDTLCPSRKAWPSRAVRQSNSHPISLVQAQGTWELLCIPSSLFTISINDKSTPLETLGLVSTSGSPKAYTLIKVKWHCG